MKLAKPWHVWEEDASGVGCSYFYRTREEARAHVRRVRFLKGWLTRALNMETMAYA